jgi:hypothetical protein
VRGGLTLGLPTAQGAPPLDRILRSDQEPPPVWPDPEGTVRGVEFSPLYKSVPRAARRDARLYELLALVDAIRGGTPAIREHAVRELRLRLSGANAAEQPSAAAAGAK